MQRKKSLFGMFSLSPQTWHLKNQKKTRRVSPVYFKAENFAIILFCGIDLCMISCFDPWVIWNKKNVLTDLFYLKYAFYTSLYSPHWYLITRKCAKNAKANDKGVKRLGKAYFLNILISGSLVRQPKSLLAQFGRIRYRTNHK